MNSNYVIEPKEDYLTKNVCLTFIEVLTISIWQK